MVGFATVTRTLSDLPEPEGKIPLLGHMLKIQPNKIHLILENWSSEYGGLYRINLAGKCVVVISNPEVISNILYIRPKLVNRTKKAGQIFAELGLDGLLTVNDEVWIRQRKLINACFSRKHLSTFFPMLRQFCDNLCARLIHLTASTVGNVTEIAIYDEMRRFIVEVIASIVLGDDPRLSGYKSKDLHHYLASICPQINARTLALFPYWRYFKLKKDRELIQALDKLKRLALDRVNQARKALRENPQLLKAPENILQVMVSATVDNGHLGNDELVANIVQLILGGEETTSTLIAWMLYFLSSRPDLQQAIYQEISQVYAECNGQVSFSEMERLTTIESLAQETLRLKAPSPMIFEETAEQMTLSDGTLLPPNTVLALMTRVGGLEEKYFHNARQCEPGRWIKTGLSDGCPYHCQGSAEKNASYFPFGGGARRCPGAGLSLLEAKLVVATVCQNFDLLPATPELAVEEEFAMTMRPKNMKLGIRRK